MPGKCRFSDLWLEDTRYKPWLARVTDKTEQAKCVVCRTRIELSNMGEGALKSHLKSVKHQRRMARRASDQAAATSIRDFFPTTRSAPSPNSPTTNNPTSTPVPAVTTTTTTSATVSARQPGTSSISGFFSTAQTYEAEILWCLKLVESHWSFNSSSDSGHLFMRMFPDSEIAKRFQCGERKAAYVTSFGIAPYFRSLLMKRAKSQANGFVLLFDESGNVKTQNKQMDIHLRIWDNDTVVTRYFTSEFMGHATAADMMDVFHRGTSELNMASLLQLSMDGPNVNWKFHDMIQRERERTGLCKLIDIGSCGLHILHGAFKNAADATGWEVNDVLSSAYWLFKDSPARREDYAKVLKKSSPVMPLKFCKTRWVENVTVVERLQSILPDLTKYVEAVDGGKCPNPDTKSFKSVKQAIKDPLMPAKLAFISSLANEVTPFLKRYQTDKPMIPFLAPDLHSVLRSLMARFVKSDELTAASSIVKLVNIDVAEKNNHCSPQNIRVGFSTEKLLERLVSKKQISDRRVLEFRMECKQSLLKLVLKLQEKSPLNHCLIRNLAFLDPRNMKSNDTSISNKLKRALRIMVDTRVVEESVCDDIIREYEHFVEDVPSRMAEFRDFDYDTDRVDVLLFNTMSDKSAYRHLWKFVSTLLLLSHGQASVERGFSVNRQIEVENLKEQSYVAQRTICDHLQSVGGIANVTITKELLLSVGGARQRYHAYLDDQKREKAAEKMTQKRKTLMDEVEEIKKKKKRLQVDADALEKSADDFALKAEATRNLTFIAKSNSLRQSAKKKRAEVKSAETQLDEKLNELKNS